MKRCLIYLLIYLCFSVENLFAGKALDRDSLVSDVTFLMKLLEETHPDPYSNFGGKLFFHKAFYDLKLELKSKSYTLKEFTEKISGLLANIQDGHTFIYQDEKGDKVEKYLPLSTRVIPGDIILAELPVEYKKMLGSKVLSVNGMSIDSLLYKVSLLTPCENIYGQYKVLNENMDRFLFLSRIFPEMKEGVVLKVETPKRGVKNLYLPFLEEAEIRACELESLPERGELSDSYMYYNFLDAKEKVMLFKLTSVMARENFQYIIKYAWDGAYEQLQDFYRWTLKKTMPEDISDALAGVPSFSEVFSSMLYHMKERDSEVLIIDLRDNGGGWTPITLPGLYMLYGDRYLNKDMEMSYCRIISPLLMEKYNTTLEEYRSHYGDDLEYGSYLFLQKEMEGERNIEDIRNEFIHTCMNYNKTELENQNGEPLYTPEKVYVITNEKTFSAAFHFSFYLSKMGAIVVGVPSCQAPNTFMETIPFQLPYTKIKGSVSNSMQMTFPSEDYRAKIFWPDIMMEYGEYKKYGFDKNTEILYLLDVK